MNLNGTLVHQTYSMGVGVEMYKRPGLSSFISRMSKQYELVIFSMGESGTVQEVCEALDPNMQMIQGRFGRENTVMKNGKYVKDLSYINRPVKDIIYIDFSDECIDFHKDNAIILKKFEGQEDDRDLIDLIPFLDRKSLTILYHFRILLTLYLYRFGQA